MPISDNTLQDLIIQLTDISTMITMQQQMNYGLNIFVGIFPDMPWNNISMPLIELNSKITGCPRRGQRFWLKW
jgi:hypothetical protein